MVWLQSPTRRLSHNLIIYVCEDCWNIYFWDEQASSFFVYYVFSFFLVGWRGAGVLLLAFSLLLYKLGRQVGSCYGLELSLASQRGRKGK